MTFVQQQAMINMLEETFKFYLKFEKDWSRKEIENELDELHKIERFETKIRWFWSWSFMKGPVKLQCAEYGITTPSF